MQVSPEHYLLSASLLAGLGSEVDKESWTCWNSTTKAYSLTVEPFVREKNIADKIR